MNVALLGAAFREELNMGIRSEVPVEGCGIFLDLASVTGPVPICCKYEQKEQEGEFHIFLPPAQSW